MQEKRELKENIQKSKEIFSTSTQIISMTSESVESVKQIEMECGLSPWSIEDYKNETLRNDSIALVAKNVDSIVGFLVARLIMQEGEILRSDKKNRAEAHKLNEAEIYNIAVNIELQNLGIGQSLLDCFLSLAKSRKISEIWLEVRESNFSAIGFYRKNKFEEMFTRKNFYRSPVENGVVMKLNLPGIK